MDRLTTIGIDEKSALLLSTVYIDEQCGYIPFNLNNSESIHKWIQFRKHFLFVDGHHRCILSQLYNITQNQVEEPFDDNRLVELFLQCGVTKAEALIILKEKRRLNKSFFGKIKIHAVVEVIKEMLYFP